MEKIIEKEWEKIKDYNIFATFEDFEEFAKSKPGGKCLRKYTSYPWSKENFFFGTNAELQEYYKTTKDIPFYLKNRIGKKFGHLTILEFLRGENNELMAKCECECGNIANLKWEGISDGNTRTCGCHNKKTKDKLTECIPKLINELWDFDKNDTDPNNISIYSTQKYWWKGYNHSFQMSPIEIYQKGSGTSFPEQALYFYIHALFNDAESRYKINYENRKVEVDILIPSIKVAIEYDGIQWHKNKLVQDIEKTKILNSIGYYVIRVRESGLPSFNIEYGESILCDIEELNYYESITESLNKILAIIHNNFSNKQTIPITEKMIKEDKNRIYAQYVVGYKPSNIAVSWLSNHWDEKNPIESYKVESKSTDKFFFKCNNGYSIFISPRQLIEINSKIESNNEHSFENTLLIDNLCPFVHSKLCCCNNLFHDDADIFSCHLFSNQCEDKLEKTPLKTYISIFYQQLDANIQDAIITFEVILKYKTPQVINFINDLISSLQYDEKTKFSVLNSTLHWPVLEMEQIFVLFRKCENLLRFLISNSNFDDNKLNNEPELNLSHENSVYDYIKHVIITSNFDMLKLVLEQLKKQKTQNVVDLIMYSSFMQLFTKNKKSTITLLENISYIKDLKSLFQKHLFNGKTVDLLQNVIYKFENKNEDEIKNCILEIQKRVYFEYIYSHLYNDFDISANIFVIRNRFNNDVEFQNFLIHCLKNFDDERKKYLIKNLNKLAGIKNPYSVDDSSYEYSVYYEKLIRPYIIKFNQITSENIGQIKYLIDNKVLILFDFKTFFSIYGSKYLKKYFKYVKPYLSQMERMQQFSLMRILPELMCLDEECQNIVVELAPLFKDLQIYKLNFKECVNIEKCLQIAQINNGGIMMDLKLLDEKGLYNKFFDIIESECDNMFFIDDWLENEVIQNFDLLSNGFLNRLKKTLKYIGGRQNRKTKSFTIVKMPNLQKLIKGKSL